MILSGGSKTDFEGNKETVFGIPGKGNVNPENGSFDVSVRINIAHSNLGFNTNTGDLKIGAGIGFKNFISGGINFIFNFNENIQESESDLNDLMKIDFNKDE